MTKTLFIEKRGCDFWKDDNEINTFSDLENYRIVFRFTGKDNTEYFGEASRCACIRFKNKRTGKQLKKPVVEHNHKIYISLEYETEKGCFGKFLNTDGLTYCKTDLLKAVNEISKDKYNRIEFVDRV